MKKILITASALVSAGCMGQPLDLRATQALEAAVTAPPSAAQCERAERTKALIERYRMDGGSDRRVTQQESSVDEILDRCFPTAGD